jgi:hypothetical protein
MTSPLEGIGFFIWASPFAPMHKGWGFAAGRAVRCKSSPQRPGTKPSAPGFPLPSLLRENPHLVLLCRNKNERKEKTRFFVIEIADSLRPNKLNNEKTRS